MDNLYNYNDYLNEGLFKSKYHNAFVYIYNYIKNMNPDDVVIFKEQNVRLPDRIFRFSIKKNRNELDPLGEEQWDDDIVITIREPLDIDGIELYIDNENLNIGYFEKLKLKKLIYKIVTNRKEIKRNININNKLKILGIKN